MNLKYIKWSALLMAALYLNACSDKEEADTEKPKFEHLEINGEEIVDDDHNDGDDDHEELEIDAGTEVSIEYEAEDNIALSELRMDLHENFDGHKHGKKAGNAFSWEQIVPLEGATQKAGTLKFSIPSDALAGPYHFDAVVLDKAGNKSDQVIADIYIINEKMARVNLVTPTPPIVVNRGSLFEVKAELEDDEGLAEAEVVIYQEGKDPVFDQDVEISGEKTHTLTIPVTISSSASAGKYELEIKVKNKDGHITIKHWDITLN